MNQLVTYTGNIIELHHPMPEDIDPLDIAQALSQICRFNGHTREFYSVAQHCCLLSDLVEPEYKLVALLKEAPAAYIGDMPRPLRNLIDFYPPTEEELWQAICRRFGVYPMMPLEVLHSENRVLATELRDLLNVSATDWPTAIRSTPMPERIQPWPSAEARRQFLDRLHDLMPPELDGNGECGTPPSIEMEEP